MRLWIELHVTEHSITAIPSNSAADSLACPTSLYRRNCRLCAVVTWCASCCARCLARGRGGKLSVTSPMLHLRCTASLPRCGLEDRLIWTAHRFPSSAMSAERAALHFGGLGGERVAQPPQSAAAGRRPGRGAPAPMTSPRRRSQIRGGFRGSARPARHRPRERSRSRRAARAIPSGSRPSGRVRRRSSPAKRPSSSSKAIIDGHPPTRVEGVLRRPFFEKFRQLGIAASPITTFKVTYWSPAPLRALNALAAQAQLGAGIRALGDRHRHRPGDGRHRHPGAEHRLGQG